MTRKRIIYTDGGNYVEQLTGNYIQGEYSAVNRPQSLVDAASEIQDLLQRLASSYPTNTISDQMVVAAAAVQHIENDSNLRLRVLNAVREGGLAAFEKAIDNPAGAFLAGAIKGWKDIDLDKTY